MLPPLEKRLAWVLVLSTLVAYGWFFHFHDRWPNPNETTRLYSSISMAENGDFTINRQIDRYGVIWDRAERQGKLYSDKAPGLSFAAAAPLWVAAQAGRLFKANVTLALKHWVARFFCVVLPSALFMAVLFLYLRRFLPDPYVRAGLVFVYAHGTVAATFSTLFFGHQPSAIMLFCAFIAVERMVEGSALSSLNLFALAALAGLLMGCAFITEYPTALASACVFVYALAALRKRAPLAATVLAGLVPVAAWLLYNKICFGSPFSVGYSHLDSPEFSKVHAKGFLGVGLPSAAAFGGTFLGPQRGLFFFSPVCLFGFVGLWSLVAGGRRRHAVLVGGIALAYAYLTSAFGYWISGDVVGPRHLTPLIPFLMIPAAMLLDRTVREGDRITMTLFTATAVVSVLITTASTIPFPFFPTPFVNPFRDLAIAFWREGIIPYSAGRLVGLKGIYAAAPYLLFFFMLFTAALFWLTHREHPAGAMNRAPTGRLSIAWRAGVLARALPVVCLWMAVVLNSVPSQVKEMTWGEQRRTLALYDPAGEDLHSLRTAAAATRPPGALKGQVFAAAGRTDDALEIYRWMNAPQRRK